MSGDMPRDFDAHPGIGPARWVLRIGVAIQCGIAAVYAWTYPTPINGFLFMHMDWGDDACTLVDRGIAGFLALFGLAVLARPRGLILAPFAFFFLLWAAAEAVTHSDDVGSMAVPAQAVRFAAPLALAFLCAYRERLWTAGDWILRLGVAVTFATHGWEALQHHPPFIDLLLGSVDRLGLHETLDMSEARATSLLTVIGWMDLALALFVLVARARVIVLWMTVWGLATAASRYIEQADLGVLAATIRVLNGLGPFALFWLWQRPDRDD